MLFVVLFIYLFIYLLFIFTFLVWCPWFGSSNNVWIVTHEQLKCWNMFVNDFEFDFH